MAKKLKAEFEKPKVSEKDCRVHSPEFGLVTGKGEAIVSYASTGSQARHRGRVQGLVSAKLRCVTCGRERVAEGILEGKRLYQPDAEREAVRMA